MMNTHTLKIIPVMVLSVTFLNGLKGQQTTYDELKRLYQQEEYETVYKRADSDHASSKIFRALSFYRLPGNHPVKEDHRRPLLQVLTLFQEVRNKQFEPLLADSVFLLPEIKELQQTIFSKAKKRYNQGLKGRAEKYFNAMHRTFDNSSPLYQNHYGFDGTHFLNILRSNIIQEEENEKYYRREIRELIDRYYSNNEAFRQWDNPRYRMANTAAGESYLKKEEKMIYYYLNLARMNPELFRKTFVRARLHVKYHGEIQIEIPVYDTLVVEDYSSTLSRQKFFNLPVHKIYIDELPPGEAERYIQKKVINKSQRGETYRYDINYTGLYRHLQQNHPQLLRLKNLDKFSLSGQGQGQILFKLYDEQYTYYNRSYEEETKNNYYYQSLFTRLNTMNPKKILYPDKDLFRTAECWAVEAGQQGLKGHDRLTCRTDYDAEACDYGNKNGFDVVLNLLIDKFVPSLGHRKILLGDFSRLGAAIRPHDTELKYNAVLDFER